MVIDNNAAGQRDEQVRQLAAALAPETTLDLVVAFDAAVKAAQWTARAAARDPALIELLQTVGELANAIAVSVAAVEPLSVPLRSSPVMVFPGLTPDALPGWRWATGLWSATAAGDASMAVRLARIDSDRASLPAAPGEVQLASSMAAWWTGRPIAPPLFEALRRTDPTLTSGDARDYGFDIIAPAVAVIRYLAGHQDLAFFQAFRDAQVSYVDYWSADSRSADPAGFISLPLAGLARAALSFDLSIHPLAGAVPAAVIAGADTLLCCAVCYQPFSESEVVCHWCASDLPSDASIQTTMGEWLGTSSAGCPQCGEPCRVNALWCWNCNTQLR